MAPSDVAVVTRALKAFADRDFEEGFALLDPEVRMYPRSEEPGVDDVYIGHEGVVDYLANWFSQWDEYESEPVSVRDAGEGRVLVVLRERGRMERTGITIEEEFSHAFTVRDGKLWDWRHFDSHEQALATLGLAE